MRNYLKYIPYYLVTFFFYWPLYELLSLLISDPYTLKGLYIYNIILFSPWQPLSYHYFIAIDFISHFGGYSVLVCSIALPSSPLVNSFCFIS